jgi:TPR repeat protein
MAPIPGESSQNPGIGSEPGSGQDEFNAARELLRGDHRQRDLSKALDLLWAGVRKGYVPAEVTLADLYRRGDGVPKNCDQAQVLLVAASKKGSPEARHLLEQMAETGCSE